jgi:POT family proton-dependent oligopeptide transporter
MTAGHFCMAFDQSFLLALLLLILGAGCLRGNLLSQVGQLYLPEDRRRADGFQIYYSMVNGGAFVAPLVTGALGKFYGWHVAFGFAGFGMLAGLIIYLTGRGHVPVDAPRKVTIAASRLTQEERRVVLVLILLLPALTMFWIAQSQIWNVYNLWARDHVDLTIGGWSMPVPWLQSLDGLGPVVFVPPVLFLWRGLARRGREPDDIAKLGVGCLLFGASVAWLACGQLVAPTGGKVPLAWAVGFHFLSAIGYLHVQPVAIGLFARTAPRAVNAMMIGVYFLSIFVGSTISGRIGGLYEQLSPLTFWLLHAAIVSAGGSLILLFSRPLRRELAPHPPTLELDPHSNTSLGIKEVVA